LAAGRRRARLSGTFNATGESLPLPTVLEAAARVAGHRGERVAVDPQFLLDHGVGYWAGPDSLPLWVPAEHRGFGNRSIAAARRNGMRLRPLEETLTRALDYERTLDPGRERRAGLSAATEQKVLTAWSAR
jgi:hypothetical protein